MRVELTNGGWADLRAPADVTERDRRPVQLAIFRLSKGAVAALSDGQGGAVAEALTADDLEALYEVNDRLAVALVERWSFDAPVTVEGVRSLPGRDYDALLRAVAGFVGDLMPSFEPDPAPDSPTVPSAA